MVDHCEKEGKRRVGEPDGGLIENAQIPIVVGSGVYWGATVLRIAFDSVSPLSLAQDVAESMRFSILLISVLICIVLLLLSRMMAKPTVQRALVWIALTCGVASFATSVLLVLFGESVSVPMLLAGFKAITMDVCLALLMVVWGLVFVSMNKRQAAGAVIVAAFVGVASFLIQACLANTDAVLFVSDFLIMISTPLLLCALPLRLENGKKALGYSKPLGAFYISRMCLGLGIGLSVAAVDAARNLPQGVFEASLGALVVVLATMFLFSRKIVGNQAVILPLVPLFAFGFTFAPFLGLPIEVLAVGAPAIIWWAWIVLSSVQLSELKRTFGIGDAFLVISEKLVVVAFWALGSIAARSIFALIPAAANSTEGACLSMSMAYFAVVFSMVMLILLMRTRDRQEVVQEVAERTDGDHAYAYDRIASDFVLTNREREVFALLAQGHSRTYIGNELFISDGTVRSHVRSIYKKLDCHKKEELFALVEGYRKPMDAG